MQHNIADTYCMNSNFKKELGNPRSIADAVPAILLAWLALIELIVVGSWILGLDGVPFAAALSWLICAGFAVWIGAQSRQVRKWLGALAASTSVAVFCLLLGSSSHDFSSDGQTYHQQAILAISDKWNPLTSTIYPGPYSLWISHYAKGPWIIAASLTTLSGNIEAGKGIAYILAFCASLLTYQTFRSLYQSKRAFSGGVALLVALNPVFCYQVQTYYFDSHVASLLTIFTCLVFLNLKYKKVTYAVALTASYVLAVNTKFSMLPYLGVIVVVSVVLAWYRKKQLAALNVIRISTVGALISAFVGFNPYFTNWADKGHPFYPLYGEGKVDIITGHVSPEFLQNNRVEKFALSVFSEVEPRGSSDLHPTENQTRLKFPFTVKADELKAFYKYTDVRIAGFGPLFGGVLTLLLLALLLSGKQYPLTENEKLFAAPLVGLIAAVMLMPESWWARYAPQTWFITLTGLFIVAIRSGNRYARFSSRLGLATASLNVIIIFSLAIANRLIVELDFRAQATSLATIAGRVGQLPVADLQHSTRHRFSVLGIPLYETRVFSCPGVSDNLIGTDTRICIPAHEAHSYQPGSALVAAVKAKFI